MIPVLFRSDGRADDGIGGVEALGKEVDDDIETREYDVDDRRDCPESQEIGRERACPTCCSTYGKAEAFQCRCQWAGLLRRVLECPHYVRLERVRHALRTEFQVIE